MDLKREEETALLINSKDVLFNSLYATLLADDDSVERVDEIGKRLKSLADLYAVLAARGDVR
jgi:hypothetical protein